MKLEVYCNCQGCECSFTEDWPQEKEEPFLTFYQFYKSEIRGTNRFSLHHDTTKPSLENYQGSVYGHGEFIAKASTGQIFRILATTNRAIIKEE
ncbi:MAG: hypothetical protein NTY75_00745 [Candidatus Shapirobacteria bacterium]|nr:hypothetical protein [Candidatus Shapirobacteria bacterium]